jgi:hypothetical protein
MEPAEPTGKADSRAPAAILDQRLTEIVELLRDIDDKLDFVVRAVREINLRG